MYVLKLSLLVHFFTCPFVSLDPIQTERDGNKFAFIQAPYINMIKAHKEAKVPEEAVNIQWPNGIIKYHLDNQSYDITVDALLIKSAINIIEQNSCIEFKNLEDIPNDIMNWIHITNPNKERECVHQPQYLDNGEIVLVLGYDCLKPNEVLHTMLHGIGMKDEVTHPLRDQHIRVLWDNINPAYHYLYRKQEVKSSKTLVEYDPLSIMQFHERAFSRNGRATIAPLEPGLLISPSTTLSQLDQMRLQQYFGHECNKRKVSKLLDSCKISLKKQEDEVNGDQAVQNESNENISALENTAENAPEEPNVENKLAIKEKKDLKESASAEYLQRLMKAHNEDLSKYNVKDKLEFEEELIETDSEKSGALKNNSIKKQLTQNTYDKGIASESSEKNVKLVNDEIENTNMDVDSHSRESNNDKSPLKPLVNSIEANNEIDASIN